jgi:hypothetical protein
MANLNENGGVIGKTLDFGDNGVFDIGSAVPGQPPASYDALIVDYYGTEGGDMRFVLNTSNVPDGTTVGYTLSGTGITASDFNSGSLTGTATVNGNYALITIYITADATTEGIETVTITLDSTDSLGNPTGSLSTNTTINDDSKTVAYQITSFSPNPTIESSIGTMYINYRVSNSASTLYWTINGTTADFSYVNGSTNYYGTTVDGNDTWYNHAIAIDVVEDGLTEGDETYTFSLRSGSTSGTVQATQVFTVQDTSKTVAYTIHSFSDTTPNEGDTVNVEMRISNFNPPIFWSANASTSDISVASGQATYIGTSTVGNDTFYRYTVSFTVTADSLTEGNEAYTFYMRSGSASGTIQDQQSFTIQDTSKTIAYSIYSFSDTTPDEGAGVDVEMRVSNFNPNIYWSVNAVDDVLPPSSGQATYIGTATIGNDTFYRYSAFFATEADSLTEGDETYSFNMRTGSTSGTIVDVWDFTIQDTSITPAGGGSAQGQIEYTTPGSYSFTVPDGVTEVSAVCVGGGGGGSTSTLSSNGVSGGGGGGGGLHWRTFSVTPGETLSIQVGAGGAGGTASGNNNAIAGNPSFINRGGTTLVLAGGGAQGVYNNTSGLASGGLTYHTTYGGGGGTGGAGGAGSGGNSGGGGGGAGGYSGNGGRGASGTTYNSGAPGQGGGGGGATGANGFTSKVNWGGGGVGIYGEGTSGTYTATTYNRAGIPGSGGSGVVYGGGGSGAEDDSGAGGADGGNGAVRIIWGTGRSYPSTNTADAETIVAAPPTPSGQAEYTSPGTYSWTAPAGVTSVCAVCVGGGGAGMAYFGSGGAGGGLGWKNNISVVPGQSYTVIVGGGGISPSYGSSSASQAGSIGSANGGTSSFAGLSASGGQHGYGLSSTILESGRPLGGSPSGHDGGGNGGTCEGNYSTGSYHSSGGGGAGGYSGDGGKGAGSLAGNGTLVNATAGSGGAGGGGGSRKVTTSSNNSYGGPGGGGVGIYGEGSSGAAGLTNSVTAAASQVLANVGGGAGSGGETGGLSTSLTGTGGQGGAFGGGGGSGHSTSSTSFGGNGGGGAVRIIWGDGRSFPSTNTGDV